MSATPRARRSPKRAAPMRAPCASGTAYPKEDLAVLKARLTRAESRMRHCVRATARRRRPTAAPRAQPSRRCPQRGPGAARALDPVSDRLDRAERLRRLEALEPDERTLMLVDGREGGHASDWSRRRSDGRASALADEKLAAACCPSLRPRRFANF